MDKIEVKLPFDFKGHFEKLDLLLQETKEQMQKFNEEYNERVQNNQDSFSDVLYGYMQEINKKWIVIGDIVRDINLFFSGGFNNEEITNLNQFLSANDQLNQINKGLKEVTNNIKEALESLQNSKETLENSNFSVSIEQINSSRKVFIDKLENAVKNMDTLLGDFVEQKIKNFGVSTEQSFEIHINNFNENFSKAYQDSIKKLENLSTTAYNKISILKKNMKISYIFYSVNGLLIFLLIFSSLLLFNAYKDYQNKSKALVNIATKLEGQISINAQGQVTLSLAKLKTILKEDKNSIYLTIKEE